VLALSAGPARAERALAFAVAGVVEAVLVKAGDGVEKGTELARLDLRVLRAEMAAAAAELKAARLELDLARKNLKRVKQLYDDLSTSLEELEEAELRVIDAEAGAETARADSEVAAWRFERGTLRAPAAGTVKGVPGYPGLVVEPEARFTPVVVLD